MEVVELPVSPDVQESHELDEEDEDVEFDPFVELGSDFNVLADTLESE